MELTSPDKGPQLSVAKNLTASGYSKPKKPKGPVKPKVKPAGQPPRPYSFKPAKANTRISGGMYDSRQGALVNQLKSGKGGGTNAVGMGGMFTLSPWAKQKTR